MANEKRLIDAEPIVKFIMDGLNNPDKMKALGHDAIEILAEIECAPTVEAVEVVHGHMVERIVDHECPWYKVLDCSECGCSVERWHNYCPNCGADM